MIHENAKNGIGKVFVGEILQIIAAFTTLLMLIPVFGSIIGNVASGLVGIVGVIIMIVGLGKAGKDNGRLKTAFTFAILTLVVGFIIGLLASFLQLSWLTQVEQIASTVFMLVVTFNVLYGCAELNPELAERADSTWKIYMIIVILDIIITIVSTVFVIIGITEAYYIVAAIMIIVDLILDVIAYFKYLSFLKYARVNL